jgi:hypothetical protein
MADKPKLNMPLMLLVVILFCFSYLVQASVPGRITYQGLLTDDGGI